MASITIGTKELCTFIQSVQKERLKKKNAKTIIKNKEKKKGSPQKRILANLYYERI